MNNRMRSNLFPAFVKLILTVTIVSCKSKSVTSESSSNSNNSSSVNKVLIVEEPSAVNIAEIKEEDKLKSKASELYSLVVSFYSIGAGIDAKTATEFDYYIRDFQEQHGDYFYAERVPWGREGEIDYCIQFPTLKKEKAEEFLTKAKEITSKSKMVHFNENTDCKRRRKTN